MSPVRASDLIRQHPSDACELRSSGIDRCTTSLLAFGLCGLLFAGPTNRVGGQPNEEDELAPYRQAGLDGGNPVRGKAVFESGGKVGDVQDQRGGLAAGFADLAGGLGNLDDSAGHKGDVGANLGQCGGSGQTDTAAGASDQGAAAVQAHGG